MKKEWEHYPRPLIVALVLFGLSWSIGIVLGVAATELGREDRTFGTASTIVAGVLVGQFIGYRVGSMMESRRRWATAAWFGGMCAMQLALLLAIGFEHDGVVVGPDTFGPLGIGVMLVVGAGVPIPLSYFGLWLGERGAVKQLEKKRWRDAERTEEDPK